MFDGAGRLACRKLRLLFLPEYERMLKSRVTNTQSCYCHLFSSRFSESWSPFSKNGLNLEEFVMEAFYPNVCCHFLWRKLLILGFKSVYGMFYLFGIKSKADLVAASTLSFPLIPMGLWILQKSISFLDIESSLQSSLMISWFSNIFFIV